MAIDYATNLCGDVTFKGYPLIHLTDNAEGDLTGYVAPGKDGEGNEYLVYWDTTKEWDEQWARHNAEHHYYDATCDRNAEHDYRGETCDCIRCYCNDDESPAYDWDNPVAVTDK